MHVVSFIFNISAASLLVYATPNSISSINILIDKLLLQLQKKARCKHADDSVASTIESKSKRAFFFAIRKRKKTVAKLATTKRTIPR